ncbi:MAG: hemolysin III family protein [Deltaproteobacteria bacterium]|nr:hemolysin III family protein [Deltaproteobacteria bacterium]
MAARRVQSPAEEIVNSATHAIGVGLGVAALALMVVRASELGDPLRVVSVSIYGASLVLLYAASMVYHGAISPRWKARLNRVDHAAIFLLIAGTYTPITLVTLRGPWGWWLFGVVWGLAILGITFKLLGLRRLEKVSVALYIGMGWMALVALQPLLELLGTWGLIWLALGGLCYTVGVLFYLSRRLPYSHAVWHLFVLAGSVCHFFAVWLHVLPADVAT